MVKEEFAADLKEKVKKDGKAVNHTIISNWLAENYPCNEIFEGYDRFSEMNRVLSLAENIQLSLEPERSSDIIDALIYGIGLMDMQKYKLDIFKIAEDFGIETLYKKYKVIKENKNGTESESEDG